jgi:hypothetical protein
LLPGHNWQRSPAKTETKNKETKSSVKENDSQLTACFDRLFQQQLRLYTTNPENSRIMGIRALEFCAKTLTALASATH